MVLERPGEPLVLMDKPDPQFAEGQVLVRVSACGVCRTDLHIVDGELPHLTLPIIPGHEIVGHIEGVGAGARGFSVGMRVGVPWLGSTCALVANGREWHAPGLVKANISRPCHRAT
jgi:propanol-preferring alcohol dehydrogenase